MVAGGRRALRRDGLRCRKRERLRAVNHDDLGVQITDSGAHFRAVIQYSQVTLNLSVSMDQSANSNKASFTSIASAPQTSLERGKSESTSEPKGT